MLRKTVRWSLRNAIEAICSDYNMRDGTGLDLLEKVRQKGITIPFLLMSGDGDHVLKQKARLYGGVFCSKTDCDFIERIKALVKSET